MGTRKRPGDFVFAHFFLNSDVCQEYYLKFLTCICMTVCTALLPHDWLIQYLHKCAGVQMFLMKWVVMKVGLDENKRIGSVGMLK